jgi:hypothetical protein
MKAELIWWIAGITGLGALLCWIGRTWAALILSWFVVGCVASLIIFLAILTNYLAGNLNELANDEIKQPLAFILEVIDLKPLATFLSMFNENQREAFLLWLAVSTIVLVTLPFITFSNAIYSALTSGEAKEAVDSAKSAILPKLDSVIDLHTTHGEGVERLKTSANANLEEMGKLKTLIESLRSEVREVRQIVENGND